MEASGRSSRCNGHAQLGMIATTSRLLISLGGSATTVLVAVPRQRAHWLLPPLYSCVLCDC